jgi:hypothetical protein
MWRLLRAEASFMATTAARATCQLIELADRASTLRQLHKESAMPREPRYGVKFVGYSADVIARKNGRDVEYAGLDFVSGAASMCADGGWVTVLKHIDLKPFLASLPKLANKLQEALLRQRNGESSQQATGALERGAAEDMVSVSFGPNIVSVAPGTAINRFIRQLTKRFIEIERVLEQAEEIGLRIKRRPYSEYIDQIAKTGICRVEVHGYALFFGGRLIFYPSYQAVLVKERGPNLFQIFPLDEALKTSYRPN